MIAFFNDSAGTLISEMRIQETPSKTLTGHSRSIYQAVFFANDRLSSCSDDKTIKVWDTASGKDLFALKAQTGVVCSMAILPNGWLASASNDKTIKLWDLEERREVRTLKGHTRAIVSLKVLNNGNLASYSIDDTIKIWNPYQAESNLLATISGHGNTKWILSFAILPNDSLATLSLNGDKTEESILRVWNPNDGQLVKSLSTGLWHVWPVLALSNDQIAIGTEYGTIKIIDLDDESKTRTKDRAHDECVSSLLQLPNGHLVSAGQDRASSSHIWSIKVWDLSNMALLQQLRTGHSDTINSLSISQNGRMLASGSKDQTIKLWPINV